MPDKLREPDLADLIIEFIEEYVRIPEGHLVGQRVKITPGGYQWKFIRDVYGEAEAKARGAKPGQLPRTCALSVGRKNAKSTTIVFLILAHLVGPAAKENTQLVCGAMSREQASIIYSLLEKVVRLDPRLMDVVRLVPSRKTAFGIPMNTEFRALANVGAATMGYSPIVAIIDECGQVRGPAPSPFIEAIITAQGAHENPITFLLSTQSASDADWFSLQLDDAMRSNDPNVVCHLYSAPEGCDVNDESAWAAANPAMVEGFRSKEDIAHQAAQAERLPSQEASFRNLILNQRVSLQNLFLAPTPVKQCGGMPDLAVMREKGVHLGIDLSARGDLTSITLATLGDDGVVHVLPIAFTPAIGIEDRGRQSRAPYLEWTKQHTIVPEIPDMVAVNGASVDYDYVAEWIQLKLDELGLEVLSVNFDRWRISIFQSACERVGALQDGGIKWVDVGQGYKSFSPILECVEHLMIEGKIRHGMSPSFLMGCANAVAVMSPAGDRKLDKASSTQRIDVLVAACMAIYAATDGDATEDTDLGVMLG